MSQKRECFILNKLVILKAILKAIVVSDHTVKRKATILGLKADVKVGTFHIPQESSI